MHKIRKKSLFQWFLYTGWDIKMTSLPVILLRLALASVFNVAYLCTPITPVITKLESSSLAHFKSKNQQNTLIDKTGWLDRSFNGLKLKGSYSVYQVLLFNYCIDWHQFIFDSICSIRFRLIILEICPGLIITICSRIYKNPKQDRDNMLYKLEIFYTLR